LYAQIMADFFQETADSVFGVPSAHLLEIGLPYTLDHVHIFKYSWLWQRLSGCWSCLLRRRREGTT
jgi:hypothetical protein